MPSGAIDGTGTAGGTYVLTPLALWIKIGEVLMFALQPRRGSSDRFRLKLPYSPAFTPRPLAGVGTATYESTSPLRLRPNKQTTVTCLSSEFQRACGKSASPNIRLVIPKFSSGDTLTKLRGIPGKAALQIYATPHKPRALRVRYVKD